MQKKRIDKRKERKEVFYMDYVNHPYKYIELSEKEGAKHD